MTRGLQREASEAEAAAARETELTNTLRHSKMHADSLASELLAKSKETAELRRELEASEERRRELARDLDAAQARLDDMEQEAQTLRRPKPGSLAAT